MTTFVLIWIAGGIWAAIFVIDATLCRIARALEEISGKMK